MKRIPALLIFGLLVIAAWAAYQSVSPQPEASLARLMPQDALVFLEARDLGAVLGEWNAAPEKELWLGTDNHEVFSSSRLCLRLEQAQDEFAAAAGLSPDMSFLNDVAGEQSALGVYDIGKLEFLYVTRIDSSRAMKSGIWQQRSKFETREVNGRQLYVRTDPQSERVAAFAMDDNYLILGTREDLVAGAVSLLANQKTTALSQQNWFVHAVQAAKEPGELRLVVHLAEVTKTPQFRTYWVQQNITELRLYESSVSDLFRSLSTYREERVLLLKEKPEGVSDGEDASEQVAELMRLVPPEIGFYRATAAPAVEDSLALLEQNVLTPRLGPAPASQLAPIVAGGVQLVGKESNLDVRIDTPPTTDTAGMNGDGAMKEILQKANVRAALQLHSSEASGDGVFVRLHSTIVLRGATDWDEPAVQEAIQRVLSPGLTASTLGVAWKRAGVDASSYSELDGLARIAVAVRGKCLFVSDDPQELSTVLARTSLPVSSEAAIYYAGFDHGRERQNFYQLTALIDQPSRTNAANNEAREPQFFSQNVASLSKTLAGVKSQSIISKRNGGVETQTVRYEWAR
jgi:hypothetical protein